MNRITRLILLLLPAAWILTGAAPDTNAPSLRPGDLLFQVSVASDFTDAIAAATARDSLRYTHVAIFTVSDGNPCVVEALPGRGVTLTPLDTFLSESAAVRVMRLKLDCNDASARIAAKAAEEAEKMTGRPYDHVFAPGDSAIYCSELIQTAYRRASGRELFPSSPMNFLAPDSTMPAYWTEHFRRAGLPVPQGLPGTNPASLSASPLLCPVNIDFSTIKRQNK